jgi:predicted dehydrogenase
VVNKVRSGSWYSRCSCQALWRCDKSLACRNYTWGFKETHYKAQVDSFEAEFSHFYDVVKKGTALAYTPTDALADLEIIQSIVR